MKSLAPLLSIIALVFGLVGCPGGGGGGGSSADFVVSTTAADFGVVGNAYTSTLATTGGTAPFTWTLFGGTLAGRLVSQCRPGVVSGTPTAVENPTATFTVTSDIFTGKTATGSVQFAIHTRTDRVSVNGSGTAGMLGRQLSSFHQRRWKPGRLRFVIDQLRDMMSTARKSMCTTGRRSA